MGAFAPSGKSLAKLMAKDVGAGSRVIELGAGTGTVTEALLANGVAPANLYLVERDPQFVKILERRFPRCHVIAADALALDSAIRRRPGLRFRHQRPAVAVLLARQTLPSFASKHCSLLKPHGRLHQFTYAGRCPVDRDLRALLRVDSVLLGIAALNLPPGFVYRLTPRSV